MVEKNILNDLELNRFIKIINELCGMDLNDKKNTLLLKLPNFLEELNFKKMADLLIKMKTNKDIRQKTLNFVTITETYFLRELSQLQEIIYYIKSLEKRVSVLSAPCASGEEVYSLAILATKHFVKDIEILGIDINSNAIEKAKKGIYNERALQKFTPAEKKKFFTEENSSYKINKSKFCPCKFDICNVLDNNFLNSKKFDVILSRNMLIYFDDESKLKLMENFHRILNDDGRLYIGSADLIPDNIFFEKVFSTRGNYYKKI